MDIVIIGSGNVAAVLGRKFEASGHEVIQVVSRNASAASKLAYEWDTESTNYLSLINTHAQVYIVAVSDNAIEQVCRELSLPGKVIAHTAASVPMEVLKHVSDHYGVFYPLQSLRKEMTSLPDVPVFIDASDEVAKKKLTTLAESISPQKVHSAGNDERIKLHVAAVIAGNFTNHVFALLEDFCKKEGIEFASLLPLITETTERIHTVSPSKVQTGPAAREDLHTIEKHLELLHSYPALHKIYKMLTESIQQYSR